MHNWTTHALSDATCYFATAVVALGILGTVLALRYALFVAAVVLTTKVEQLGGSGIE